MKTKAQSSTEFLIITTVILTIVVIAISAFGPIEGIGNSQKELASQTYWNNADISIKGVIHNTTHSKIFIKNNLRYDINITNISLDDITFSQNITLQIGESNTTYIESNKMEINQISINYLNLKNNQEYEFIGEKLLIQ